MSGVKRLAVAYAQDENKRGDGGNKCVEETFKNDESVMEKYPVKAKKKK